MSRKEKLFAMVRIGFAESLAYRGEFLIWFLTTNMPLVMMLLWMAVAKDGPVGRFGTREFAAYFLTTVVVRLLTGAWVAWQLTMEIRTGTLARRLLRPVHPFVAYACEQASALPLRALTVAPLVVIILLTLGTDLFSSELSHWVVFPLALAGALCIRLGVMMTIGSLALFWDSALSLYDAWLALFFVFSGYTIPLELFPAWIQPLVNWLPFRYMMSFPVEIVMGHLDGRQLLVAFVYQWGYALLFSVLALTIFRRGLKRYAAFGG
ncbi:MAG: ABC-2 family transporter protein [Deltaproteobacteria bacterium]|nr:ABC-2 family transporter protein [Deltaproteobacteria bacterium]